MRQAIVKTPLLALGCKWFVSIFEETQNLSYINSMAYFLSIYTLNDSNKLLSPFNCRGKSFLYFRGKIPSVSIKYQPLPPNLFPNIHIKRNSVNEMVKSLCESVVVL